MIAWQHMTRPRYLDAGVVAFMVHIGGSRGAIGLLTTPRFDGSPERFIAIRYLPDFGRIMESDHMKRVHRVGSKERGFFMQFDAAAPEMSRQLLHHMEAKALKLSEEGGW